MIDDSVLRKMIQDKTPILQIVMQAKSFAVESSTLAHSDVPVSRPTTRGGVYFSDTKAFKAKVLIRDSAISEYLSKAMLGPNTEFAKIQLVSSDPKMQIFANLTNYVQKGSGFELSLTIVEASAK
ncbi:MAG: hypothetical protein QXN55_04755 [Candidatus Nitrosotenuis sp.]